VAPNTGESEWETCDRASQAWAGCSRVDASATRVPLGPRFARHT